MLGLTPKQSQEKALSQGVSLVPLWKADIGDFVEDLKWSPDGAMLAAASVSGPLEVFTRAGVSKWKSEGHKDGSCVLTWRPDGEMLVSGGQDGRLHFWNPEDGSRMVTLGDGKGWVQAAAWHESGKYLAFSEGKRLRVWHWDGRLVDDYPDHPGTITGLQWKPGAVQIATACYGGVHLHSPEGGAARRKYPWGNSCLGIAISPDNKYIASGQQDNRVHIWEGRSGKDMQMSGYPGKVQSLSWDATARFLATSGALEVMVWNCGGKGPSGRGPIELFGHDLPVTVVEFHPAGLLLASGSHDARMLVWDVATKKMKAFARMPEGVSRLCWNAAGNLLAVGDAIGTVTVFEVP